MNRHRRGAGLEIAVGIAFTVAVHAPIVGADPACDGWKSVDPPAGAMAIAGVEARSADDAWAIAYLNPDPKDVIRWDGTAWSLFPTGDVCNAYAAISVEALDLVGPSHALVSARASTGPFSSDQLLLIWDGTSWDNCHSLTLQPDIMGAPRNGAPNAIVAATADDAWILGAAPGIGDGSGEGYLTVHWDGSELTEESTSGGPGNASKTFRDGVAFASNDIWAVGQYRIIGAGTPGYHGVTYHWDGTSWNYVPNPAEPLCCQSTDLNTVAGVAPDDVWAAGSWGIEPLFMHWDGSSWSIVPSPATTGSIEQMVAIASDDVWAVDFALTLGAGKFYHWDGASWSIVMPQEIPGAVNVNRHSGMAAVGPCDIWTAGSVDYGQGPEPLIERLQPGAATAVPTLASNSAFLEVSPNPIQSSTRIHMAIPGSAPSRAQIYDVHGRRVRILFEESIAGDVFSWDGRDDAGGRVPGGVYFLRVESNGGDTFTEKLTVVR